MKNIIKALGGFGAAAIVFATSYFYLLYEEFSQLIIALGIVGIIILGALVYVYNWMVKKDESDKGMGKSIDMTRDYIREVEKKKK